MNKEKNLKDQRASLRVDTRETQQCTLLVDINIKLYDISTFVNLFRGSALIGVRGNVFGYTFITTHAECIGVTALLLD